MTTHALGLWDQLSTKSQEKAIALGAGLAVGVAGSAALNLLHANNVRQTFSVGQDSSGNGGVDVDLLIGVAALAAGLFVPGVAGMALIGLGLGSGTQILGREGAVLALEMAKKKQSTSGLQLIQGGRGIGGGIPALVSGYRKAG